MQVLPGQSTLAFYTAENVSDRVITGVSTYNVAPMQAGSYFNKIQCFCFEVWQIFFLGLPLSHHGAGPGGDAGFACQACASCAGGLNISPCAEAWGT